ncbi:TetR/AcrR family transcriptional regulator [Janibacter hoylei]|uniref:TetR/AcrR family transcriptional regulator n=1 Tax=Janibacter hoylei TaxID=364298 RepID=UPI00249254D5|nr:TetR/AcrR family transcriptional regulator [Janibacter hoylei]
MSSTTSGTRVQRMPRAQRRAQLLEAALTIFVSKGYHSAAMEDIAEEAGVSKPVLYQHFPGKLELYLALLDSQCDHLEGLVLEALNSSDDHEERVYATVLAFFEFVADEGGAFRLIYESDLTNEPQVRHRIDALEAQLGEAMAQRIIQDTPLPMELAEMLGLALAGAAQVMARTWLAHGAHFPKEVAAQAAGHLAWRGLGSFPVNRMGAPVDPGTDSPQAG